MDEQRRKFIKQLGYIGIGFSLVPSATLAGIDTSCGAKIADDDRVNAWLHILENGEIRILTGKMELGQGIRIAVAQVAAEELNTNLENISVNLAETGVTPDEGYTAGSNSITSSAMQIRQAAATARETLLKLASEKTAIAVDKLQIADGYVLGATQKLSFSEILQGDQLEHSINPNAQLQKIASRKWVGQPVKRKDISAMVRGDHTYVQDLKFPDMVHARIIRPKSYTASLESLDTHFAEEQPGFLKVIQQASFIAVLAEEEYQAIKLRNQLTQRAQWKSKETLPSEKNLNNYIKNLPVDSKIDETIGDFDRIYAESESQHSASYSKPYIMHAANGPSCAVAYYKNGQLDVWSHTQGVYPLRETLSALLGITMEKIHVKGVPGSGCYGHNGADDVAAEAALIATKYPEKHIRLQWMRDDEHGWEPYGTAMLMDLKASLNSNGKITAWNYNLWSDAHSTRPGGNAEALLPARYLDEGYGKPSSGFRGGATRNAPPYYTINNLQTQSHIYKGPLRTSALRGLGSYANLYAIECFMDELAFEAKTDPVKFRLNHLDDPRAIACLTKLQEQLSEVTKTDRGGIGYAFSRYKNKAAYCCIAAKVYVDAKTGAVQVKKMWSVIDAGETINPDGLKNQTEGGMIQSASWAFKEKVHFDKDHITSLNWESYPIFRFPDIPEVEVTIIDRPEEPPLGAGEAAQGPATAAVINAIFDATGVRVRNLPVNPKHLITA